MNSVVQYENKLIQLAALLPSLEAHYVAAQKGLSKQAMAAVSLELDNVAKICGNTELSFESYRDVAALRSHVVSTEAVEDIGNTLKSIYERFKEWLGKAIAGFINYVDGVVNNFEVIEEEAGKLLKLAGQIKENFKVTIPAKLAQKVAVSGDFNEGHFDKLTEVAQFGAKDYPDAVSEFYGEMASVLKTIDPTGDVSGLTEAISAATGPLKFGDTQSETYPGNVMIVTDESGLNYRIEQVDARTVDADVEMNVTGAQVVQYLNNVVKVAQVGKGIKEAAGRVKASVDKVLFSLTDMEKRAGDKGAEALTNAKSIANAAISQTSKVRHSSNILGYLGGTLRAHLNIAKLKIKTGAREVIAAEDYETGPLKGDDEDFGVVSEVKDEDGMHHLDMFDEQSADIVEVDNLSKGTKALEEYHTFVKAAGPDGLSRATERAFAHRFYHIGKTLGMEEFCISLEQDLIEGPGDERKKSMGGKLVEKIKAFAAKLMEMIRKAGEKIKSQVNKARDAVANLSGKLAAVKERLSSYLPNGSSGGKRYEVGEIAKYAFDAEGNPYDPALILKASEWLDSTGIPFIDKTVDAVKAAMGTGDRDKVLAAANGTLAFNADVFPPWYEFSYEDGKFSDQFNLFSPGGEFTMKCRDKGTLERLVTQLEGITEKVKWESKDSLIKAMSKAQMGEMAARAAEGDGDATLAGMLAMGELVEMAVSFSVMHTYLARSANAFVYALSKEVSA